MGVIRKFSIIFEQKCRLSSEKTILTSFLRLVKLSPVNLIKYNKTKSERILSLIILIADNNL